MHDPLQLFRTLTGSVADVVDTTPEPAVETPCTGWCYAQLLGHLVGGDRVFVGLLTGTVPPPSSPQLVPDAEQPAPSPADYRQWSDRLAQVMGEREVRGGTFEIPVGRLTGDQVLVLRAVEHLLHGWDLAKAAGAPTLSLALVADALAEPALQLRAAVGAQTLGERRPFAAPVEVGASAPVFDQLLAAFGRDPDWSPDPVAGYARVVERFAGHVDVELPDGTRRGFGADGLRVDHQVFACTHRGRLMVKLPADEVEQLIGTGLGAPLAKPGQRPMREWVLVPFDGAATARAERAYAFVSGRS